VLYRMSRPGMAYGAVAAWQSEPVERSAFLAEYANQSFPAQVAAEVGPALDLMNQSRQHIEDALGEETMHRFWDDPLDSGRLEKSTAHREDLRQARLEAENAWERLNHALEMGADPATLQSFIVGARMLDYVGMKNLYAVEIAGFFKELGPTPKATDMWPVLGAEIATQDHSRVADLMDTITEMREAYREAWLAEYTTYRLGTALGRWDAEYEYWRRFQKNVSEVEQRFTDGDKLPALESLRPRM